jgi:hypothetical protein
MQGLGFVVSFAFLLSGVGMHTRVLCSGELGRGGFWIALMLPVLGNVAHPYATF